MITVHLDTIQTETASYIHKGKTHTYERETIEITIRGDRRRVRCSVCNDHITLFELAVRFNTGSKVWPGSAIYWHKTGDVNNLKPNIDKNGYFILVGYAEDFAGKPVRSQHNAVA